MADITIRALTTDDLTAVANLHMLAFLDSALTKLGIEAIQRYYLWQLNGPHDSLCIGAFDNLKLTGFCFAGVFRGAETGFIRHNIFFLIWHLMTHPWLLTREIVLNRVGYGIQAIRYTLTNKKQQSEKLPLSLPEKHAGIPIPITGKFGVLSIAVHPEYQGLGIGKLLLQNIEIYARHQGFSSMRLTVHTDNYQAILFYEKHSWKKVPAADGIWRGFMVKNLGSDNE